MTLQPNGPAPYCPPSAVTTVIEGYRNRGLGTPITIDVLVRAGVSESLSPRTMQGLKLLNLVDKGGNPAEQLDDLRAVRGEDEFQARLQAWLRSVYADVLQYTDPSTDGPDRVAEAFRGYTPNGQRTRMATLLIGLWKYAGLPVPESDGASLRTLPARSVRRPPKVLKGVQPRRRPDPPITESAPTPGGLPPGLIGLLQQIPRDGEGWTADRRDGFLTAFRAVLDFTVPIVNENEIASAEDDEAEVNAS